VRPIATTAALFVGAFICVGCSSKALDSFTFVQTFRSNEKPVEPNIFPASFKQQILSAVPSVAENANGYREAYYSDPARDPTGQVTVYTSCVRFAARDSGSGQYAASKDYVLYYYGGQLSQFVPATENQCARAAYKPFPELDQLCRGAKCARS
jgi:hypothetical protein